MKYGGDVREQSVALLHIFRFRRFFCMIYEERLDFKREKIDAIGG